MTEREQQAKKLTEQAKESYKRIGREWTALAGIFSKVIDGQLWNVEFGSFEDWLDAVGDKKASQAYAMARTYRDLEQSVPEKALSQMTFTNAQDFARVPVARRTAAMVQDATEMPNNQFRKQLNVAVPGLALEERSYRGFQLEKSQLKIIDQALELVRERQGLITDSAALEWLCAQIVIGEGESPYYIAARLVFFTVQAQVGDVNPEATPSEVGWSAVIAVVNRLGEVFGFKRPPSKAEDPEIAVAGATSPAGSYKVQ
jgi:hypothetical protein